MGDGSRQRDSERADSKPRSEIVGAILAGTGLVWLVAPSVPWLGRLPGDIVVEKGNIRFYFPIVTCLVLSLLISLVLWAVHFFVR